MKKINITKIPHLSLIIGLLIILLKIFIIDIDLPNFRIACYQPLDEAYYVSPAITLYKTGDLGSFGFGSAFITNIFTYFSLFLFGNNYTGLRFSSILFALISIIFFYLILKRITQKKLFIFTGVVLLAVNYPFTLSNIVVEPTIVRMATGLISLYLLMKWSEKDKCSYKSIFILSTICTLLWLFTYLTNAFVLLALLAVVFAKGKDKFINRIKRLIPIIIGVLLSVLVFYCIFYLIPEKKLFDTIARFSGNGYDDRVGFTLKQLFVNFMNIFNANIFRLNSLLLFLFIISILMVVRKQWRSLFKTQMIPFVFYFCFLLQTIFLNDFHERKLIFLLPFVVLIIIQFFDIIDNDSSQNLANSILLCIPLILLFVLNKYFNGLGIQKQFIFSIIGMFFVIAFLFIKKYRKISLYFIVVLLIGIECYNTYKFSLKNTTYYYKETFQYLDKYKNKKFIGGFSYGFTLYNTNKAYLNVYLYKDFYKSSVFQKRIQEMAIESRDIDYMIGYEPDSLDMLNKNFEQVEILLPVEKTVAAGIVENRNVILYKEKEK